MKKKIRKLKLVLN